MRGATERRAVAKARRIVCEALAAHSLTAMVRVQRVDPSLLRFMCVCAHGRVLEVALQRTGWMGGGGAMMWDGFEVMAIRRRVSGRLRGEMPIF
jgi:hypothetical protein